MMTQKEKKLEIEKSKIENKMNRYTRYAEAKGQFTGYNAEYWQNTLEYIDNKCPYCGESMDLASVEHIRPKSSEVGDFTKDNIIPACEKCNNEKADKDIISYLIKKYGEDKAVEKLLDIEDIINL